MVAREWRRDRERARESGREKEREREREESKNAKMMMCGPEDNADALIGIMKASPQKNHSSLPSLKILHLRQPSPPPR